MKTEAAKPPRFSRRAKVLIGLAGAFVIYTVVGFFVVPAVVKSQMLKRIPAMTGRPASVEEVKFNPFTFAATISGFAIKEKNGAPFAGWEQLYVEFKPSSLFTHGWGFNQFTLVHPFALIARSKDEKLNFEDILTTLNQASHTAPTPAPASKSALPVVKIDIFRIEKAEITVDDAVPAKPVHTKLLPISVKLDGITTEPDVHNPMEFAAVSDSGESFHVSGAFTLDPPQVTGNFKITSLDLKKYSPYLAKFAAADVTDGRFSFGADYTAGLDPKGGLEASLTNGAVLLQSFSLKSTETGEEVVSIPTLAVVLRDANLVKKVIHVGSIQTTGGSLLVRQSHDGKINLLSMIKVPLAATNAAPVTTNTAAAPQQPWNATVDDIDVENYAINVEDNKPAKPAKLSVDQIVFKAKGISTVGNNPINTEVAVRLNTAGTFAASGTVQLQPPSADLTLNLAAMDLRPYQPYVEEQVKLAITRGQLSVKGHARYASGKDAPMATFEGDVGLTNFATTDLIHFKDFVKMDSLAVNGINFAFQPNKADVQEIKIAGLSTSVMVDASNQINLLYVLPKSPAAPTNEAAAPGSKPAGLDFPVTLGTLEINNASFHLSDQSIEPNCLFDIQELSGTVKGLSSSPETRGVVDLHGKMDEVSSFAVTGSANPLSKDLVVDVGVDCKNMDLTPFTPYMEKYGGYPLQRGKLMLALHYNIVQQMLKASNVITISQLTLGPKNNSTNATPWPVKLGVAVLKDRAGNINLDVPLSGSVANPDFKVWPLIRQIIVNILMKAATSPFKVLGALFGGGEELSYVDFQPGTTNFAATEQPKIDKLSKALYERPALQLEISATADPVDDSPALARMKLNDQIRSMRAAELIAAGSPAETVQSVKVEPADYSRLLKVFYYQNFPATNVAETNIVASGMATTNAASTNTATVVPWTLPTNSDSIQSKPSSRSDSVATASHTFVKAGELMVRESESGEVNFDIPMTPESETKAAPPVAAQTSTNNLAATTTNSTPVVPEALTDSEMETKLLSGIQITTDDLRALMQARARSVQAALVNTGKIEGERIFILAPKPFDPAAKGQARANLSLD